MSKPACHTKSIGLTKRSGPDHDPRLSMSTVDIGGIGPETGIVGSKRAAEQVAATKILQREGVWKKARTA